MPKEPVTRTSITKERDYPLGPKPSGVSAVKMDVDECTNENYAVAVAADFFKFFTDTTEEGTKKRAEFKKLLQTASLVGATSAFETASQSMFNQSFLLTALPNAIGSLGLYCGNKTLLSINAIYNNPQLVLNALVAIYVMKEAPGNYKYLKDYITTTIKGISKVGKLPENAELIEKVKGAFNFTKAVANQGIQTYATTYNAAQQFIGVTGYLLKETFVYLFLSRTSPDDGSITSHASRQEVASRMSNLSNIEETKSYIKNKINLEIQEKVDKIFDLKDQDPAENVKATLDDIVAIVNDKKDDERLGVPDLVGSNTQESDISDITIFSQGHESQGDETERHKSQKGGKAKQSRKIKKHSKQNKKSKKHSKRNKKSKGSKKSHKH